MTLNSLITWIIIGGIAGLIAEWVVGGYGLGCIGTVIVGIIGAFVGGWLFGVLHISIGTGLVNDIITAAVGAIVILLALRIIRRV